MRLEVTRSSVPEFEEYIDEIRPLWENRWLTNMGIKHKKLECRLLEYLDVKYLTLFTNGHLALESAIRALGLQGEVITTPFTFASTTHAIVRNGLTPVFCDINHCNYTINSNKIEELITDQTSAIIPVHVYGYPCNFDKIDQIVKKHSLKVIYDAAHAFGVNVDGLGIGSFGDASMFSFHATKVFNTIEGGAITCSDPALREVLNNLKNFGITGQESVEYIGGNAKMNEFQAAMGLCNLRYVKSEIEKRKILVNRYSDRLDRVKGLKLNSIPKNVQSNYAYYPVLFDGYQFTRNQVFEMLKDNNVFARKYFYPLTSDFECYKGRFNSNNTPTAQYVADRILTLPLYADLAFEDVDKICDIILGK